MMRALILLAGLLLWTAQSARADEAVDPEALATAKKIQEATHASALGDQVMAQMLKVFTNGLNQSNPGHAQDVSDILNKLFLPAFHDSMPALLDESARTYARHFTAVELKQLLAFYQTPLGQKMIAETPGMSHEQMAIGQAFAQKIVADIRQKLLDAIKEKGLQAPQGL